MEVEGDVQRRELGEAGAHVDAFGWEYDHGGAGADDSSQSNRDGTVELQVTGALGAHKREQNAHLRATDVPCANSSDSSRITLACTSTPESLLLTAPPPAAPPLPLLPPLASSTLLALDRRCWRLASAARCPRLLLPSPPLLLRLRSSPPAPLRCEQDGQ